MKRTLLTLSLAGVLGLATAGPANAAVPDGSYNPMLTWGGPTFVKFLGFEASLRSESWFFGTVNQGPTQSPDLTDAQYLFANKNPANSVFGNAQIGADKYAWNQLAGAWAKDTELHFGLFVQDMLKTPDAMSGSTNVWFYTGDTSANPDARIHARVTEIGKYHYTVGFEDLCKSEPEYAAEKGIDCLDPKYNLDWDYNDHIFEVYSTPEPVSMSLLVTGLLGLAGVARRRRKKQQEND